MTDDKIFTELPQDEQQMLIGEVKRLKLTCEPKKMKASELYALIENAEKNSTESSKKAEDAAKEINNSTQEQKPSDETQPETNNAENAEAAQTEVHKQETKPENTPRQPVKKSKKDEGLCISCYSKVYDGVCSGCGRLY